MPLLVDRRILAGGLAMLAVGMVLTVHVGSLAPVGTPGMSDEEAHQLITMQRENQDVMTLAGMLVGVGFLLILVSFGARRRRRGGSAKRIEKKPDVGM